MYKVNLLGKNTFTFQNIFPYEYPKDGNYDFESVNLNTSQFNFGIEYEISDNVFVMGNYLHLNSKGNDQLPFRDNDGYIINYEDFSIEGNEAHISTGVKINFSKKSYLAFVHDMNKYRFNQIAPEYDFNQSSIVYVLKF